ncbi:MAG: hypothetical protein FH756_07415 [Firmicutes bacterium]|nr:hypothetical protein [Bacillota bacterium]
MLKIIKQIKMKWIYILSMVVLASLLMAMVYYVPQAEKNYTEIRKAELIKTGNGWVLQFNMLNDEERKKGYTVVITSDGREVDRHDLVVHGGCKYKYSFIPRKDAGGVSFSVYNRADSKLIASDTYLFN